MARRRFRIASTAPGRRGLRSPGFSLLEMLMVLVLVAAATLLAMAAFGGGMRGMQLRSAAKDLAAQLRFTRAVAISSGQVQDFVIDPADRRWRGARGRSGTLPEVGEVVFTGAGTSQFPEIAEQEQTGVVRFFPDGAATGGRVRLLVNDGGWDVDVAWLTGEVRLHRVQDAR